MALYDPNVVLLNLLTFTSDIDSKTFRIEYFVPSKEQVDGSIWFNKQYKGLGTFNSNFQFKSFPFDSQKLYFKNTIYLIFEYLPSK